MINAEIECKKSLSPVSRKWYLNREWTQEGNGQWPRAHSDSFRPSCGDVDDCVETGEHIVDVGLTLQGQLY